jgi:7,8-dihydropterin-6-yl-methyl-4-(beta-D-ribofuranosyl)aminobenzene 5'-phosphate synthase
MKITTLIENSKEDESSALLPEHGVSLFFRASKHTILFDTGKSDRFLKNAQNLGIHISDVDILVVSHSHYDHGGGLKVFFQENNQAKVYLKEEAFSDYYSKRGLSKKYIGLDHALIDMYPDRFFLIKDDLEIDDGIFILSDIVDTHTRPSGNSFLFERSDGKLIRDRFLHELILVIREDNGMVVFTGCSHRGILNMIETVENKFNNPTIKAVLGGFHLMNPIKNRMSETEDVVRNIGRTLLQKKNLKMVYSGHCTGKEAYSLLKAEMKDKLDRFSTGKVIRA